MVEQSSLQEVKYAKLIAGELMQQTVSNLTAQWQPPYLFQAFLNPFLLHRENPNIPTIIPTTQEN